jgi:hypothetical protein
MQSSLRGAAPGCPPRYGVHRGRSRQCRERLNKIALPMRSMFVLFAGSRVYGRPITVALGTGRCYSSRVWARACRGIVVEQPSVDLILRDLRWWVGERHSARGRNLCGDVACLDLCVHEREARKPGRARRTMLRTNTRTLSSLWMPTTRAMSPSLSVTYIAVSFLGVHRSTRSMACITRPRFLSCKYQPGFSKLV